MTTQASTRSSSYQFMLVALLSINFGIVFIDRNALNILMPFVQPELGLNNTQVGMLASALSLTWALAAFGIGYVSDRTGSRKGLLIVATVAFSLCSFLTGMAQSFALLLGVRLLMGVAEGGIMPISQTMVTAQVSPERRGLAMGVTQNFGSNLLGSFVAPVALVAFAGAFGWRQSFVLAGVPGLISAALMWWLIREPPAEKPGAAAPRARLTLGQAFAERNILICCLMAIILVSYFVVCLAFMPLFLTQVRGISPESMSWLMSTLGLSATAGAFLVSGISDRVGRRPMMILMPFVGVILPLGAMYFDGSLWLLAAMFFLGWGVIGIFPLFMGTVPSESIDARHLATALGLCMGSGEVLGGVLAPSIAGYFADRIGLQAPLWIMSGLTVVGGLLAFGLRETAPRMVGHRGLAAGVAAVPTDLAARPD